MCFILCPPINGGLAVNRLNLVAGGVFGKMYHTGVMTELLMIGADVDLEKSLASLWSVVGFGVAAFVAVQTIRYAVLFRGNSALQVVRNSLLLSGVAIVLIFGVGGFMQSINAGSMGNEDGLLEVSGAAFVCAPFLIVGWILALLSLIRCKAWRVFLVTNMVLLGGIALLTIVFASVVLGFMAGFGGVVMLLNLVIAGSMALWVLSWLQLAFGNRLAKMNTTTPSGGNNADERTNPGKWPERKPEYPATPDTPVVSGGSKTPSDSPRKPSAEDNPREERELVTGLVLQGDIGKVEYSPIETSVAVGRETYIRIHSQGSRADVRQFILRAREDGSVWRLIPVNNPDTSVLVNGSRLNGMTVLNAGDKISLAAAAETNTANAFAEVKVLKRQLVRTKKVLK